MPKYGKAWVDELVDATAFATIARREAARSQLKLMVDVLEREAQGQTPGTTPPVTQPHIFAKPGWMGVRYDALSPPAELARAGVFWVAAVLSHGANADGSHNNDVDDQTNQAWLAAGKAQPYRDVGIKVGGWGWHEVQPELEAVIARTHINTYALHFWIANGEAVWKPDDARFVKDGPERFAAHFAAQLGLAGKSGLPVAWSVLGAAVPPNVYGYDYRAFTSRGWHILPQAYPQQSPEYKLSTCIDHAVKRDVPLELVHPTIANYGVQKPGAFQPTIATWEEELRAARARGVVGFSVWAHDFTLEDVRKLVQAVA
jgi:hypothetical protein